MKSSKAMCSGCTEHGSNCVKADSNAVFFFLDPHTVMVQDDVPVKDAL